MYNLVYNLLITCLNAVNYGFSYIIYNFPFIFRTMMMMTFAKSYQGEQKEAEKADKMHQ